MLGRRRPGEAQPRLRDRRRRLPPVAARARLPRAHRPAAGGQPAAPATTPTPARVFGQRGPLPAARSVEAQGHAQRALRARRDVRRLPRRHQRAADQEPARPLGRRLPDRAHVHRVAEQPLRRSPRQRQLRSPVQARLPVVPHAAGLRPARAPRRRSTRTAIRCRSRSEPVATDGKPRPSFTHHFVGGNALVPHLIGKDVDATGNVAPYPELSTFSFSSADHKSPYSRGFWTNLDRKGGYAQQQRLAWDRLRNVLSMTLRGPADGGGGRPRADHDHRRQHRQRPRLPDRLPRGAHRLGRGARRRSRPPAPSCRSATRSGSAPRVGVGNLTTRRDDRSRLPGLQLGAAGRLGRSVLDPVQGGGVAGQRLPDAGPALRGAAEHGDRRARAADRRRRRASSTRRRTRAGCRSSRT